MLALLYFSLAIYVIQQVSTVFGGVRKYIVCEASARASKLSIFLYGLISATHDCCLA